MKIQTISVKESTGRTLSSAILRAGGTKLLAKGHLISEEDTRMLETEGMAEIFVSQLEEGEVGEYDAVTRVACKIGRGAIEIRLAPGGKANLFATERCCVLVDDEVLKQVNSRPSMVVATTRNFTLAGSGTKVAVVKSAPFTVGKMELETLLSVLDQRRPILDALPIRTTTVAVLYTDPVNGERARQLFEKIIHLRLNRLGTSAGVTLSLVEEEGVIARALQHLLTTKVTLVLIASTTGPPSPNDVIGRAMVRVGCKIECSLAPVDPGNTFLLGYKDDVPIVCAPGCFHHANANAVDLILPPMLAGYRVSKCEVAGLGHGGCLSNFPPEYRVRPGGPRPRGW
jgi:molybdenum cofactor cytidylyltransferase